MIAPGLRAFRTAFHLGKLAEAGISGLQGESSYRYAQKRTRWRHPMTMALRLTRSWPMADTLFITAPFSATFGDREFGSAHA
jgi:hypothetical protein